MGSDCCYGAGSTPDPGFSASTGAAKQKNKKKKKEIKKKEKAIIRSKNLRLYRKWKKSQ